MVSGLKVKIHTEILAEYDGYVVIALYIDNKFSQVITVNEDQIGDN